MDKMRAVLYKKYGPPEVLEIGEAEKPFPKENEVLIKVYATSVTNSDIFIRGSKLPFPTILFFRMMIGIIRPRKQIIGEVLSGKIERVGNGIKRFKVGDNVFGLTGFSLGGYAQYKCMKEVDSTQGCLAIMPKNIDFNKATSAAYGGLLAFQFMEKVNITSKSKVLIYGASGTTGTIAVQYAKYLGAEVTAVCSSTNIEFVKSLGADKALDYTKTECAKELEEYDFVFDAVGKAKTSELKRLGMKALTHMGKIASIDDSPLLLKSDRLDRITKLVESGKIIPVTDRVYSLEQIVEAHKYVETGHKRGNVAVTVNSDL
jgi:NADPH:quinone reductase-like Zn-dependent oxidoreductase